MFVKRPYDPEGDELSGRTVAIIVVGILLALGVSFWLKPLSPVTPSAMPTEELPVPWK